MCHMRKKATLRELHLRTSEIVKRVADGETFVIVKQGAPVAELRPFQRQLRSSPLPDREEFLTSLPLVKTDSGRILEEDRP